MLANARLEQMRRSGDDWLLTLADGRTLRAPLVIAADGANSAVRRLTGVATREWDYLHHAIVTSVRSCQTASNDGLAALHRSMVRWRFCRWSETVSRIGVRSSGRPRRAKPSA